MTDLDLSSYAIKNLKEIAYDMNILIVEDDEMIQKQLKLFLSKFFKYIDTANNGVEASALYETIKYDLVLTDLSMPFMGGLEFTEKIKSMDETQSVIVISANTNETQLIELVNIGIDGYLLKPLSIESVIKQINKICQAIYNRKLVEHLQHTLEDANKELLKTNTKLESTLKELTALKETTTFKAEEKKVIEIQKEIQKPKKEIVFKESKKTSAVEFLDSYPLEVESVNENLEDLEARFYTLLSDAEKRFSHDSLHNLTKLLHDFAREIELIPQFSQIANGILEVEQAFKSVEDHNKIPAVLPMLGSLFDNLEKWRKGIFYFQDVEDIHYMDKSLLSDAQSLQLFLSNDKSGSDSDSEMEFF